MRTVPLSSRSNLSASSPRALLVMSLVVGTVLSCRGGLTAPNVAPRGTLALSTDPESELDKGPLRVLHTSPRGELSGPSEISILFSKPMRPLDLAGQEAPFPATVEPAVPGRFQWIGTRAGIFVPERPGGGGSARLPGANEFVVKIPSGTRSLDGDSLKAPHEFRFSTERPSLVRTDPSTGFGKLKGDAKFDLYFNQAVSTEALSAGLALMVGDAKKAVPFRVERPFAENEKLARLIPLSPLPLASAIQIDVLPTLTSKEGPLPAGEAESFEFDTYGPLVASISCYQPKTKGPCDPRSEVSFGFSNAVKFGDVKKAFSVEPAVALRLPTYFADDEWVSGVSVSGNFKPGSKLTFRVSGTFADEYDQKLRGPASQTLTFGDYEPEVRLGVTDGALEPDAKRPDPVVATLNMTGVEVITRKLEEDDILRIAADHSAAQFDAIAKLPGVTSKTVPAGRTNTIERQKIGLMAPLGGSAGRGVVYVGVRYPNTYGRGFAGESAIVQVTDLAITAKVSNETTLAFVSRLSDGKPVNGASVKIRRPGVAGVAKTTGADGMVVFSKAEFTANRQDGEAAVIFASLGDDRAHKLVSDSLDNWDVRYGEEGSIGLMWTDRGIYRPGDSVKVKGVVREAIWNGLRTPTSKPIKVRVDRPGGDPLVDRTLVVSAFGTFDFDVPVPRGVDLGTYFMSAQLGEEDSSISGQFEVAEYRAAEFEVKAESDRPSYIRGQSGTWTGRGTYFFGAPMAEMAVRTSITRLPTHFSPEGHDDFETDDGTYYADLPDSSPRSSEVSSSRGRLDRQGALNVTAKLDMPGQRGAEQVTAMFEVTDLSRQVISSSTTALVHPADHYVGIKLDEWFVEANKPVRPEVLALSIKGQRVDGKRVKLALIRRTWSVARQTTGTGSYDTIATPTDRVVGSCEIVSSQKPGSCDLTPTEGGYYVLRASSTDAVGNAVSASRSLYASGSTGGGFADSDTMQLDLVLDKKQYTPGQTAKVLVKSPWKTAEALVTFERSGIFTHKVVTLSGATPTISVPITEEMRPNVFVSVVLLKGRTKEAPVDRKKPDVGQPSYRFGHVNLPINQEGKKLDVIVKANKSDLRPGEQVTLTLDVKDRSGKPAKSEIAVFAADEGVLSLIGYETPDPMDTFGRSRDPRVSTLETRARLARTFDPFGGLGADKGLPGGGGDAPEGRGNIRKDFRQTALWSPSVVTDEKGHAEVRFTMPDSLTTFRVMAVATTKDDKFGSTDTRLTVSQPLMARPALPRFLRAGDKLEASVVVSSKGDSGDVDVALAVTGATLVGESKKSIKLEQGKSVEVRFPVEASTVGRATFKFDVKSAKMSDSVELVRDVQVPMALETVALYGSLKDASAEKLGNLSGIRSDVGSLDVNVSSSALVGLGGSVDQLVEYPHGCTEQLTSRLVPLVFYSSMAKSYGITLPKNTNDVIQKTVAKLLTHQQGTGGFGFWPDSPNENAWVTAYALLGLHSAKTIAKVPVTDGVFEQGKRYLKAVLADTKREPWQRSADGFILDVLADLGSPDPGGVSRVFEEREKMPTFARASLLSAMAKSGTAKESIALVVQELEQKVRLDGGQAKVVDNLGDAYAEYLDSDTRTTALVLSGLLTADPRHPLAVKLVGGLLAERRGGAYRTTQESAWVLMALAKYAAVQEASEPNFQGHVFAGDEELFSHTFQGKTLDVGKFSVPTAKLAALGGAPLSFQVEGDGRMFYEARLKYARKALPKDVIDRGFYVDKRMRRVTPDALAAALETVPNGTTTTFNGSDLVLVDIVVVTPTPRSFVVVDDPLPAGLEAIDMRLATTDAGLDVDGRGMEFDDDDRAEGDAENESWFRREIRDDRVSFFIDHMATGVYRYRYLARATSVGTFVAPPTRAEGMYAPETFGRTAATRIEVRP